MRGWRRTRVASSRGGGTGESGGEEGGGGSVCAFGDAPNIL